MDLVLRLPYNVFTKENMYEDGFLADKIKENPENKYVKFSRRLPKLYSFGFNNKDMAQLFADVLYRYNLIPMWYAECNYYTICTFLPSDYKSYNKELYPYDYGIEYDCAIEETIWWRYEKLVVLPKKLQYEWFLKDYDHEKIIAHLDSIYQKGLSLGFPVIRYTNFKEKND